MVKRTNTRITRRWLYALVTLLLVFLFPELGRGQTCPTYTNTLTSANITTTSSAGVASVNTLTITSATNLTTSDYSNIVVSGKLELMFTNATNNDFKTGANSTITVCSGGILVISGDLFLGNKADLVVQTGGILIVLGNVDARQGNIDLQNNGKLVFAGTTDMQKNALQGTGTNYIFNDISSPATPGIKDFDDLMNNDPGLLDIYASYSCPSAQPITLDVSPSYNIALGSSVTINASSTTTFSNYSFYISGATSASQSTASSTFITSSLQNGNKVFVYARTTSGCFQTATTNAFVVSTPPAKPTTPTATTPICQGTATSTVQTTATSGASTYTWSIVQQSGTVSPGSISGTGTSATITWNPSFSGVALVSVTGVSGSGTSGPVSDALSITVNPLPSPVLGNTGICAGGSIVLSVSGSYSSYLWSVSSSGFSLSSASSATPTLTAPNNDTLFPVSSTDLVAYPDVSVKVTDGNGCFNTVSNNSTDKQVTVFRIPRTGSPYHISNNVAK